MRFKVAAKHLALIAMPVLALAGCKVSGTGSVNASCGGGKPCTVGGSVGITVSNQVQGVTPDLLGSAISSGYQAVVHVPTSELTLSTNAATEATLTATTDTGYKSSVVVSLVPAGSAPSTLASGYTAYTFAVPSSSALSTWIGNVNANTATSMTLNTTALSSFAPAGNEGNYTVYAQISSGQTGTISNGSTTFTDSGDPGAKCGGKGCTY